MNSGNLRPQLVRKPSLSTPVTSPNKKEENLGTLSDDEDIELPVKLPKIERVPSRYHIENKAISPGDGTRNVLNKNFSPADKEKRKVVFKDNKWCNADEEPLRGYFKYSIDKYANVYIWDKFLDPEFKGLVHESILGDQEGSALSGELFIKKGGILREIDNQSGSYCHTTEDFILALSALEKKHGLDFTQATVCYYDVIEEKTKPLEWSTPLQRLTSDYSKGEPSLVEGPQSAKKNSRGSR